MGKFVNNNKVIIYSSYPVVSDTLSPYIQVSLATFKDCGFAVEDLHPVKYWLCSYGSNNNADFWGKNEMSYASPTIVYKPININHDRHDKHNYPSTIIGVNYASAIQVNPKNNKESILAKAVLFSYLYKGLPVFQDICEDINKGTSFASMECVFSEFSPVHPETGELLGDIDSEEELFAAMKSKKAARRFDNPLFIGSAFLKNKAPADKDCDVSLDNLEVYYMEEDKVQYLKETTAQDNILTIALALHRASHEAYNLYVEYGYSDSLERILESHHASVEKMEKVGVNHNTPIDIFDKKKALFLPVVKGWVGNSRIEMERLASQDQVIIYNSEPEQILANVPAEFKDRITVKKDDISTLTKWLEYDVKLFPFIYNNKELLSISTLYIANEIAKKVKVEAMIGDIVELGLKDTTWIVVNDKDIIYFNPSGLNIYPMASEILGKGEKLDISYIRRRFGDKEIHSKLNLIPCEVITITQKESLFTVLNSISEVFGGNDSDVYMWEKGDNPVLLWRIGDNSNTDIVVSKDFIVEGYCNDNTFHDIIYWDTYLHLPYKERLKILQENFPVVKMNTCSLKNIEQGILQFSGKNSIIVKDANSVEFNNIELVPGWLFEATVLGKENGEYIVGNDVIKGALKSNVPLNIGDKKIISCKWIVPSGDTYLLKDLEIVGQMGNTL